MPWTEEEKAAAIAAATEAVENGERPRGRAAAAREDEPQRPVPTGKRIFNRRSLEKLEPLSQEYPMPDGSVVWVHPATPEEAIWLNAQAARDVQRLRLEGVEADLNVRIRAQVYQVICVAKDAPGRGAEPVFQPRDADTILRELGYPVVERIAAISDHLGANENLLRTALADFFGGMSRWLATCASRLSMDSLPDCQRALSDCALSVSSWSAATVLSGGMPLLPELPPVQPAKPAPSPSSCSNSE